MTLGIPKDTNYCNGVSCEQMIAQTLALISGRWAVAVLEALHFAGGPVRFRELQRRVGGITQKELSRQLTRFVHHRVVHRRADALHATRVDYELSARGRDLLAQLDALGQWSTTQSPAG